jgi:hypothetical protein
MVFNPKKAESLLKKIGKSREKWVFFCSTHDIPPESLPNVKPYLARILELKHRKSILITSKLREDVCKELCEFLAHHKGRVEFRVTISTFDEDVISTYESKAPSFAERLRALQYARRKGFRTSVSIEPYLTRDVPQLVSLVEPYCTGEIWLGKMNYNVPLSLRALYTREVIQAIYNDLQGDPQVRWKDSIQAILGIDKYGNPLGGDSE